MNKYKLTECIKCTCFDPYYTQGDPGHAILSVNEFQLHENYSHYPTRVIFYMNALYYTRLRAY